MGLPDAGAAGLGTADARSAREEGRCPAGAGADAAAGQRSADQGGGVAETAAGKVERIMGSHLIENEFQSDKYPTTPRGKVPLSTKDPAAQDLLWSYAQRRRAGSHGSREADREFADDLEAALRIHGFHPPAIRDDGIESTHREAGALAVILRDLEGGATPPPWTAKCAKLTMGKFRIVFLGDDAAGIADARLIAVVRNGLPKILDALKGAWGEIARHLHRIDRLRAALKAAAGMCRVCEGTGVRPAPIEACGPTPDVACTYPKCVAARAALEGTL